MSTVSEANEKMSAAETSKPVCFFVPGHVFTSMGEAGNALDVQKASSSVLSTTDVVNTSYKDPAADRIRIPISEVNLSPGHPIEQQRHVFDLQFCKHPCYWPGCHMRSEGDPPLLRNGDPAPDQAYDNMGIVRDFYREVFGNNAILGQGVPLIAIVHYDLYYPNAWWHPLEKGDADAFPAIIFGDGWENDPWKEGTPIASYGGCFGNFVGSLEIVAHELTHGLINSKQKLDAFGEAGALDEHLADVFATMCEQWHKKQSFGEADWLIGEDLVCKDWKGAALRSMKAPGSAYTKAKHAIGDDVQVSHMSNCYNGDEDGGGVHINSGILNKAFYLVAERIGGNSWEKPGQIWYKALHSNKFMSSTGFQMWALLTRSAAAELYGKGGTEYVAVQDAWKAVGVFKA